MAWRGRRSVIWRVPLVGAVLLIGFAFQARFPAGARRLSDEEDACEGGGFTDPLDLQSPWAGLVYLLGILYSFQGIAMVCEDYFVAALNRLIEEWKISPDVAGATFMAAGTSSPELFAALVGLFVSSSSDTGVGTVVGSAVFNILIIIGGSLLVIPAGFIQIEIPPLLRDTSFYLIALLALLLSFNDGKVTLLESSIMVSCYVAYVFANAFFGSFLKWYNGVFGTEEATALVDESSSKPGQTRRTSVLNSSVYSEAPAGEVARHTFATRLDLMSHTRQSIVSNFYGLQEGEEVLEMEVDNTRPLERTYADLHPKQRQHIEALFSRAAVAALDAAGAAALDGDDEEKAPNVTADGLADQEDGAAAAKDGALISPHLSVPEHLLVEALSREALASPRIGPNTMLDEYGDLFKILRMAGTDGVGGSISWSEFLPAYATWHQCALMTHLRPVYSDSDINDLKARFADSDTDHDGKLSSTEMQRAVANAIPTLNGPQRWSLAELFDYSHADVTQLGFLMTCTLFLGYQRALEAERPQKDFKLPEAPALADAPEAGAGKKQKRFSVIQAFEPDQSIHVPHNIFDMPKDPLDIAMYLMGFPFALAFRLTIVDCRQPKLTKLYGLTLFLAIVWLGILVTFMISWAEKMGCLWGLTPSLLGMTLCAGGTSLPDCLASMIVARQGEGMMAVSNALGSNIFDILFGLGFPFFLKTLIINEGAEETVSSQGIVGSVIVLLVLQVAFTLVVVVQRLRVGRAVGYLFVGCYGVFMVYCYISLQVAS